MALHSDLPIYKLCFDLLGVATDITRNMPRDLKNTLGSKIQSHCIDMLALIARANIAKQKAPHIEEMLEHQHIAEFLLRLAHEKKFISHGQWAAAAKLLGTLGKQAGGWLKQSRSASVA